MQGSQVIALLIGILLLIVTIGWLVFIWYRRHVSMEIMVSHARAKIVREQRGADYDVERGGQQFDHIMPPKYRSDAWQRPSTRLVPRNPKEPDYVILRRMKDEDDLYRTRAVRREYLSPSDVERRHLDLHTDTEPQQAHQQNKGHQQRPQQQQKQGKKRKQKKGNLNSQNGQNGRNNSVNGSKQGNQSNRSNNNSHGDQAIDPPKRKRNKKGNNKGNNSEDHQQPQERKQDKDSWVNNTSGQDHEDNDGQKDSQINQHIDDSWSHYNGHNNHRSNGSQHNGSDWGNGPVWPSSRQNSKHGSNRGSQSDSNGNSYKRGRRSRHAGGSQDNDPQKKNDYETNAW
ncbi:hypothetical protein F1880_001653 [Penicillium rolfsii]|nr:hypothetical protein F1880_001653 [Penicillium rolfsii]